MDCTASDPRPDWPDATPTARLTAVSAAPATPCPDVQPAPVVAQYNLTKHTGRFYELYYKDPLERPCTCFWKDREVQLVEGGKQSLRDADRMWCGAVGKYTWFNATEDNFLVAGASNANFDLVFETPIIKKIHCEWSRACLPAL